MIKLKGGGFRQLGIQVLAVVSIAGWSIVMAFIFLYGINRVIGLRVSLVEEIIGADIVEHGIGKRIRAHKPLTIISTTHHASVDRMSTSALKAHC